jgi:hypothetical protein
MLRLKTVRALIVLVTSAVLVVVGFAIANPVVQRWGSTAAERSRELPHDSMLTHPLIIWNHGMTIQAPAERVWPWIAQLGDVRGGFYSYTFIENLVAGGHIYKNADRIVPELQSPAVGTPMIADFVRVAEVNPPSWLLAEADPKLGIGWTWIWLVEPTTDRISRLFVRARIQPPGDSARLDVLGTLMNTGGFVMEKKMMQGIRERAEGRVEPPSMISWEIAVWILVFIEGVAAGVFAVFRRRWFPFYAIGIASICALFVLTLVQPVFGVRIVMALLLALALVWASMGRVTGLFGGAKTVG